MLLQHYNSINSLAVFQNNEIDRVFERVPGSNIPDPRVRGTYATLGGIQIVLLRNAEGLCLWSGGKCFNMTSVECDRAQAHDHVLLTIRVHNMVVSQIRYDRPLLDPPISGIASPFAVEEDYDFGLFLSNVCSDKERQNRMFRGAQSDSESPGADKGG